ncbi:MAG: hypothetical protein M9894_05740 [Planctomycetes bacterium]|nr:hypothetical protein [Planctomycetota bacterium]
MGFLQRLLGRDHDGGEVPPRGPAPPGAHEIHRLLARGGQTVSLRQLRSYGLHAVRVLDAPTIHRVVKDAVDQVLRERPRGAPALTPKERARVEEATRAHVLQLMQQNERLQVERAQAESARAHAESAREQAESARMQAEAARGEVERRRAELERQIAALREEIEGRQSELAHERARVVRQVVVIDDESFVQMERRIVHLFERMARDGELEGPNGKVDLAAVQRELTEVLAHVIADVKAKHAGADEARIEELELRIAKLNQALSEREEAIRKLAEMKGFDPGLASIYDSIQGLDPSTLDFQRKSELLKEVFVQNLELLGLEVAPQDLVFPAGNPAAVGIPASGDPAPAGETAF